MSEEPREWIFTFGVDSHYGRRFVRIVGTHEQAREEMVRRHGRQWAFQYRTEEEAGVERWRLEELK